MLNKLVFTKIVLSNNLFHSSPRHELDLLIRNYFRNYPKNYMKHRLTQTPTPHTTSDINTDNNFEKKEVIVCGHKCWCGTLTRV